MNVIKLILRPCEDRYLTNNSPTIISNDNVNLPSSLNTNLNNRSPHLSQQRYSISIPKHKGMNINGEFQVDYVPSILLSSRSKNSYINALANNTMASTDNIIKIIDLKIHIAHVMSIRPDMLNLYIPCNPNVNNGFQLLYDKENFCVCSNNGNTTDVRSTTSPSFAQLRISSSRSFENLSKPTVLYYKVSNDKQKIVVDIFQNKVDKILMEVSPFCSVYMLKGLINQKLSNNKINFAAINSKNAINTTGISNMPLNVRNQTIYGSGLIDTTMSLTKALSNKKFNDNTLIENIVSYYMKKNNEQISSYNCENRILNLIMIESSNKKCVIGLDFRFNYMRNFKRINFDETAPSFREVTDGLNLFVYCMNPNCELNNQYFIITIGYGTFDIFSEMYQVKCPKCKGSHKELRSIGMINAKWSYKGLLKGKRESKFEGDGFTLENFKLFALPEIQFLKQFSGLLIEVKEYKNQTNITEEENNDEYSMILDEDNILDNMSDLDDVDLYFNESRYTKKKNTEETWMNSNSNCNHLNNTNNTSILSESYVLNKKSNIVNNMNNNNVDIIDDNEECEIKIEGKDTNCCVSCGGKKLKNIDCCIF